MQLHTPYRKQQTTPNIFAKNLKHLARNKTAVLQYNSSFTNNGHLCKKALVEARNKPVYSLTFTEVSAPKNIIIKR
jgi:hypothetical protein